jgi:formylglycine-generating enzyme required for sulfatase activity
MMGRRLSLSDIPRRWGQNAAHYKLEPKARRVRLVTPYYMSVTEITRGQFAHFVDQTGYRTDAEKKGGARGLRGEKWGVFRGMNWRHPGFDQSQSHPVACVSWNDARAFCKWLSKSAGAEADLPKSALWEYACRAGSDGVWPWGNRESGASGRANVLGEGEGFLTCFDGVRDGYVCTTAPVGTFRPNGFGLKDMIGNVAEWCLDGPHPWHAYRGGGWDEGPGICRAACRFWVDPRTARSGLGFRVTVAIPRSGTK